MRKFSSLLLLVAICLIVSWFWPKSKVEIQEPVRKSATESNSSPDLPSGVVSVVSRTPIATPACSTMRFRGRVLDAETSLPIESVKVGFVRGGDSIQTWTSMVGQFEFQASDTLPSIHCSASGYKANVIQLGEVSLDTPLPDIFLEPSNEIEIVVTWRAGGPVEGASIGILSRMTTPVPSAGDGSSQSAMFARTGIDGRAQVRIPEPRHLFALDESGHFGTALAVPGNECSIVLEQSGANFVIRSVGSNRDLSTAGYSLRRLSGLKGSASLPISGAPSRIVLSEGLWTIQITEGPFVLEDVLRDGVQLLGFSKVKTEFEVFSSTKVIEIVLKAGMGLQLIDGVSGGGVVGEFSYQKRLQDDGGAWKDGILREGIADLNGRSSLVPMFSDYLASGRVSLRIDAPGYASKILTGQQISAALRENISIVMELEPLDPTGIELHYPDNTPFVGLVIVKALGANCEREVFVGAVGDDGGIPAINLEEAEGILVTLWNGQEIASRSRGGLVRGGMNRILVDVSYGQIRILRVPVGAKSIVMVGIKGDEYQFTREGNNFISPALYPGTYFVGPKEIARRSQVFSSRFVPIDPREGGRSLKLILEAGRECRFDWLYTWDQTGIVEGRISSSDTIDGLVLIPIYAQEGQPAIFGPRMRRIYISESGNYRVPEGIAAADYLAVCALDMYGTPIPIDVIHPGASAIVSSCSFRLLWTGPTRFGGARVSYTINDASFSIPLDLVSSTYDVTWGLESPLIVGKLPCGETLITIQVGDQWFTKQLILSCDSGGVQELKVPW